MTGVYYSTSRHRVTVTVWRLVQVPLVKRWSVRTRQRHCSHLFPWIIVKNNVACHRTWVAAAVLKSRTLCQVWTLIIQQLGNSFCVHWSESPSLHTHRPTEKPCTFHARGKLVFAAVPSVKWSFHSDPVLWRLVKSKIVKNVTYYYTNMV